MRLDQASQDRGEFLLAIGEGRMTVDRTHGEGFVKIPDELLTSRSLDDLIQKTYGDDIATADYANRAIFTPKNDDVTMINRKMKDLFPGEVHHYKSADTAEVDSLSDHVWPTEFLNTLAPNGIPPHELALKVGMPIVLLRNLSPAQGLCNGTRMKIDQLQSRV